MAELAVDVVLLPSGEMMDKAIEANKELSETSDNEINLNKIDCLPHISLAMGCISEKDIPKIDKILGTLAKTFKIFKLKTISTLENKAWFRIRNDNILQLLHESVMNRLKPYFAYEPREEMFFRMANEKLCEPTLSYVKQFPIKSGFENFTPHITVGSGDVEISIPEHEFMAGELALCQLGNYCTCRKILLSHMLKKDKEKM